MASKEPMLRDVPICKRGFLTSIKKSPSLPIHKLTHHAQNVCAGLEPDYNGKKFKSPLHQIKDKKDGSIELKLKTSVRPLLPTYNKLKQELERKKILKHNVIVDGTIIGICDVNNKLHLMRPIKK